MNLRKAARGQNCQLQIPGTCNHNNETTVLAHVGSHGTAKRNHDDEALFACSDCHDAIDRRNKRFLTHDKNLQKHLNADRRLYIELGLERMAAWIREETEKHDTSERERDKQCVEGLASSAQPRHQPGSTNA